MEVLLLFLRLFLGAIFLVAGIGKFLDKKGSVKAVTDFGVPAVLAKPAALLLPPVEVAVALVLLFNEISWFGAIGASILLLVFIGGMLWQMKLGNAPDCHCFGQIHSEPVSKKSLGRNVVFLSAGLVLVFAGRENQGLSLFETVSNTTNNMQIIFGLIIIGLLITFLFYLKNILSNQMQILRRLEILELISGDGGEQHRENIGNPLEGLPIGAPLPAFQLPTADGRILSLDDLLKSETPILFLNVSPSCNPCQELLPEIKIWEEEFADRLRFVFISNGSAKENLAKFGSERVRDVLLQDERELSELFEMKWTPMALFVSKSGIIASHPAAGDEAIRGLIEKIRETDLAKDPVYITGENGNGIESKIGNAIPDFIVTDHRGEEISAKIMYGKKTLVTFWSMTCPYCVEMMEELSEWDKIKGLDEPNLIVFSDGQAEEHANLKLTSPIIPDEDYKIAEQFGMHGTPSAVLIDETGRISSETAIGAGQIWALLGKRK